MTDEERAFFDSERARAADLRGQGKVATAEMIEKNARAFESNITGAVLDKLATGGHIAPPPKAPEQSNG